jgi:hypothetical protein
MSSTVPSAAWLLAAAARPVHASAAPVARGGRHRAPETPGAVELLTSEQIAARPGRHAEPEWSREVFDPARDEVDAFEWLGFDRVSG